MQGTGSIYKRGSTYWAQFYRDGKRVQMSLKTDDEKIAEKKLQLELRKNDDEFTEPKHKRVTIAQLVADLFADLEARGKDEYLAHCKSHWEMHMKKDFGTTKAVQLTTDKQMAYIRRRQAEGYKAASINRELSILQQAFKLGYEAEPALVKRMPTFKRLPENNARRVFATPAQLDALRKAAAMYPESGLLVRTILEMAIMYGWRRGELLETLRVGDVRIAENTIRLEHSKNGEAREVPMPESVRVLVTAAVAGRDPNERLWPYSMTNFFKAWHAVRVLAGVPHLHFHDLRRTSARAKRSSGVDTSIIMDIQGWKTEAMFRRYGIVDIQDKVDAFKKLDDYNLTTTPSESSQNRPN